MNELFLLLLLAFKNVEFAGINMTHNDTHYSHYTGGNVVCTLPPTIIIVMIKGCFFQVIYGFMYIAYL